MKNELIVTTYNSVRALRLCLATVLLQQHQPDAVCIADDGSGPETAEFVAAFAAAHPQLHVRHLWHEDRGFLKNTILNKAIVSSQADYLVFVDGDVLMHPTFFGRHLALAEQGRYATGSMIRLTPEATRLASDELLRDGTMFGREWLRRYGVIDRLGTWLKTMPWPTPVMAALDTLTPVPRRLCGGNASLFRTDALAVNGYDEDMRYGGADRDFGVRLHNAGIRGRFLRYSAPLLHLDHSRGYRDPKQIEQHHRILRERQRSGQSWVDAGIVKGPRPA